MNDSAATHDAVRIECQVSESFTEWLAQAGGSLCVTTYQAGKVAMIGWDGRQVTLLLRDFEKPMGICVQGPRLAMATRHEVWLLANAPLLSRDYLEDQPGRYDALYLPRATYHTGDLHTHDIAFVGDDLILAATRFSCLARLSHDHSFTPVWRPKFVTDLVPEDRCHLNGLAMRDGQVKYVTALGTTDEPGGWRENKATGGVVIDIETGEVVLDGLAMPHSPRWHDGKLWVLDSGKGELLCADPETGESTTVCGLAGYLRGLCFVGPYAVTGLSKIREKHTFGGLPIQEKYSQLQCGVAVVDTRSGTEAGLFEFTAGCDELFGVEFLPNVFRPMILNSERPEGSHAITNLDSSFWFRPKPDEGNAGQ